jgi:uncharacterized protein (TIGR02246 family)
MSFMAWLLALLVLGGAQQTDSPAAIVASHWAQYADALSRHDVETLTNLYSLDARLMPPGGDDIIGRLAIRAAMVGTFAQRTRPIDVRMIPREVAGYDGVIYDQGDYIETIAPQDNPRRAVDVYNRYFAVWVQQPDGAWKIARMMLSQKQQPGH